MIGSDLGSTSGSQLDHSLIGQALGCSDHGKHHPQASLSIWGHPMPSNKLPGCAATVGTTFPPLPGLTAGRRPPQKCFPLHSGFPSPYGRQAYIHSDSDSIGDFFEYKLWQGGIQEKPEKSRCFFFFGCASPRGPYDPVRHKTGSKRLCLWPGSPVF